MIADTRACGCYGGPEFYQWIDPTGRRRCTNCNGLRVLRLPLTGAQVDAAVTVMALFDDALRETAAAA